MEKQQQRQHCLQLVPQQQLQMTLATRHWTGLQQWTTQRQCQFSLQLLHWMLQMVSNRHRVTLLWTGLQHRAAQQQLTMQLVLAAPQLHITASVAAAVMTRTWGTPNRMLQQ
jgi:hypothetical protein